MRHSRCDNVRSSFQSRNHTILPAPFSTKFHDAPTDVVSLLLCDWLQHATTLYEESKTLTCCGRLVASCRSRVVLVITALSGIRGGAKAETGFGVF